LVRVLSTDIDRGFVCDSSGGLLGFGREAGQLVELYREQEDVSSLQLIRGSKFQDVV
jgi:hypothetical protein